MCLDSPITVVSIRDHLYLIMDTGEVFKCWKESRATLIEEAKTTWTKIGNIQDLEVTVKGVT